jgi:unsaturated chondroitin disaccharide hydrolase
VRAASGGVDIVILGGESAISSGVAAQLGTCTTGTVTRVAGANRYATAIAVSKSFFPSANHAYIATGQAFADALAGAAAAAGSDQPVLLADESVPQGLSAELQRLGAGTATILGGPDAVSHLVATSLWTETPLDRLAGADRYATAALIAERAFDTADTVYIATGANFPDALAAVPAAANDGAPILLVRENGIPGATAQQLARLRPTIIKIVGGVAVVSPAIESALGSYAPSVIRLSGANRYATAAAISKATFPGGSQTIFVTTGSNFPDALAGSAAAGSLGAPVLLSTARSMPAPTVSEIQRITGKQCDESDSIDARVAETLDFAIAQARATVASVGNPQEFPRSTFSSTGAWSTRLASDWTSGFFPALLWRLYLLTGAPDLKNAATSWSSSLATQATRTDTHDVGFMVGLPASLALEATGSTVYRNLMLTAAGSLASRYNPSVGAIRSWDFGPWQFPVIVDNLMNLELLYRAANLTSSPSDAATWRGRADSHSLVSIAQHIRIDGSTYHVVDFNPVSGSVLSKGTYQGFSDESTWARGQAWALHGLAATYRETLDPSVLSAAREVADFFVSNLPGDFVPYWDFDVPVTTSTPRDSSAASIGASGLLELSILDPVPTNRDRYFKAAVGILDSLMTPAYLSNGSNSAGLLLHGAGGVPLNTEIDVTVIWGDYYFVEALMRYQQVAGA